MKRGVLMFICSIWLLSACTQDEELVQAPRRVPNAGTASWVTDITTARPVDVGAIHNAVLARFNARLAAPGGMNYEEYVLQIQHAANKALEPYGPSRPLTKLDCEMAVGLAVAAIDPYFDLTFQDPSRSDPMLLLNRWLERGYITEDEYRQLSERFANHPAMTSGRSGTASEGVLIGSAVFEASLEYWTSSKSRLVADGDWEPPVKELRNTLADGFGGIIGGILGGPIAGGLTGMVTSTLFIMDRPGGWCIACGPGGTGDSPPLPPCGGYTGIGPCPD